TALPEKSLPSNPIRPYQRPYRPCPAYVEKMSDRFGSAPCNCIALLQQQNYALQNLYLVVLFSVRIGKTVEQKHPVLLPKINTELILVSYVNNLSFNGHMECPDFFHSCLCFGNRGHFINKN